MCGESVQIDYSFHRLTPLKQLNAFSDQGRRQGVLFRIDQKYYIDYTPWEQFGDASIDDILEQVKNEKKLPSFLESLLEIEKNPLPAKIFLNHSFGEEKSAKKIKLKYLNSLDETFSIIEQNKAQEYRVDFNGKLDKESFSGLLEKLAEQKIENIEYIEDPCVLNEELVKKAKEYGYALACDRINTDFTLDYKILKPNIENVEHLTHETIFSSYMGHELGIYHCYQALLRHGNLELYHGIHTPGIYEEYMNIFELSQQGECSLNEDKLKKLYTKLEGTTWKSLI